MKLHFLHTIEGWLSPNEAYLLYTLAYLVPGNGEVVEIGSFKGKSTIALAKGLARSRKKGYVWAIDPHKGVIADGKDALYSETYTDFQKNIVRAQVESQIKPIIATSQEAAKKWEKPIRVLFLDGLHDYKHTKEDYELWAPFVIDGGVVAFHDAFCGEKGVEKVIVENLYKSGAIQDVGVTTSILYYVVGKPSMIQSCIVFLKFKIIQMALVIHRKNMPWFVKKIVIHFFLRLFLITKYTIGVHLQKIL